MITTRTHALDDGFVIEKTQDCSDVLKYAEEMRGIQTGKPVDGLGYFVGTIPETVVEDYMRKTGVSYHEMIASDEHVKRILSDPDFSKFRVWKGRI